MPRPDRSYRTTAIILKRRDFGEADRLLTILTPEHGKQDVIAKGARKLTSHKMGHVELLTRADMLIHTGRELGVAAQAEMTLPLDRLREDLVRGAYAGYCAELVDKFVNAGFEDTRTLYRLTEATLIRINDVDDPRLSVRYFEVQLLLWAGFGPELSECVVGGEPIEPQDQVFSPGEGGVVCPQHAPRVLNTLSLPMLTLKTLRLMQRSRYEQVEAANIPQGPLDDSERILSSFIAHILEKRPLSAEFLRRIRRESAPG
ncbi:MAG: DNA repair protein RecO [Pleurocapsa minor GSE-CHR-MK-17-07R]|jgi:DNA repair protein RecO (recombination protein O)|nr:DNA repair protein RecO [Pleurocapsa minor GSE-CHR-MK 17-07R]